MPTLDAVQTFAGISNENEFYSHHYLAEVFKGDVKARLDAWDATEALNADSEPHRAPPKKLTAWSKKWFSIRNRLATQNAEPLEKLKAHAELQFGLLEALGYGEELPKTSQYEFVAGTPVPVWQVLGNQLAIVPAYEPGKEDEEPLENRLTDIHYLGASTPTGVKNEAWLDLLSEAILGADAPPRFVLLVGLEQWLLIDRYKWPNNRVLRFDWVEILDRKDTETLKAASVLLHKESLAPKEGNSLLESLDENAHKHAFGVSEDLKYALREAIELLGNEAARQLRMQAESAKRGFFSGKDELDPTQLSLECLRMVYRLLFMFYIEARPELGYVPIGKSEVYQKGYSLESLRDLELKKLTTDQSRNGTYFDSTLRKLFKLVSNGCGLGGPTEFELGSQIQGAKETFALAPLDSKLFNDELMPLLSKVKFPNSVWQQVIHLMSLTRGNGKNKRRGRVSYQLLSINQLGAVYEALLSFRGFFAAEDLCEVKPSPKNEKTNISEDESDEDTSDETGNDIDADDESDNKASKAKKGGHTDTDKLENAWFVPKGRIGEFEDDEIVYDIDESGLKRRREYAKGTFIYRLAGRDRQKSASYYTPQVLTSCLVKYALKELLNSERVCSADDILTLTVCEPAMGSAAFLNEAVNQLAEAYLERKQSELGKRIPHDEYARELQKVRMYLADRNVFGVDLNPVAVELAEVSIWLNAIYGDTDSEGQPLPARVPWFGYQLFDGNSLIGARNQLYGAHQLVKGATSVWYEAEPRQASLAEPRKADEVWHFLLPDPGMSNYTDKNAKRLYPREFEAIKKWRKEWTKPLQDHEVGRLQQLSIKIDELWAEHTAALARDRAVTEDSVPVWPFQLTDKDKVSGIKQAQKEAIRSKGMLNSDDDVTTPYRRLKLVMDYWCALWFWPIERITDIPSREQWWLEIGAILEGNIIEVELQSELDLSPDDSKVREMQSLKAQGSFDEFVSPSTQSQLSVDNSLMDKFGQLRISKLRENLPRILIIEEIALRQRFLHWELVFSDILLTRGGFDLVVGNPPWLRYSWNELEVLGDFDARISIRKNSPKDVDLLRDGVYRMYPASAKISRQQYEEMEGMQSFLKSCYYPQLSGSKTNLYKGFIVLGNKRLSSSICALLHPVTIFDDPKGGELRKFLIKKIRCVYQFQNENKFFPIGNRNKFAIFIFSKNSVAVGFNMICSLYSVSTLDRIESKDFDEKYSTGLKNKNGKWNESSFPSRLIRINEESLKIFSYILEGKDYIDYSTRLFLPFVSEIIESLKKIASYPFKIDINSSSFFHTPSTCWNETVAVEQGLLSRRGSVDKFPNSPSALIYTGPMFHVNNPLFQTPRIECNSPRAYDNISIQQLSSSFLPRNVLEFSVDDSVINSLIPTVGFKESKLTEFYRIVYRKLMVAANERSFISSLVPPGVTSTYNAPTVVFEDMEILVLTQGFCGSLVFDFFVKNLGIAAFSPSHWGYVSNLSSSPYKEKIIKRVLSLNCLTKFYSDLWNKFISEFCEFDGWLYKHELLDDSYWEKFKNPWVDSSPAKSDFVRFVIQAELDVLVAKSLDLSLSDLMSAYNIQFPVLAQYEHENLYSSCGKLAFSTSKSLSGVGLKKNTHGIRFSPELGMNAESNFLFSSRDELLTLKYGFLEVSMVDSSTTRDSGNKIIYELPLFGVDRCEIYSVIWNNLG